MELHPTPFLGESEGSTLERAGVVILPVPYEGGVSYGGGAARGPDSILAASAQVEFYDAILGADPRDAGIATVAGPLPERLKTAEDMDGVVHAMAAQLVGQGKFVVALGGDHSISPACVRAQADHHGRFGVIQFDAHADLRPEYEGSPLSHACAMARIRETTPHTLQLGVRSLCQTEAEIIRAEHLPVFSVQALRRDGEEVRRAIRALPGEVYITIDVDAFDGSVVWSTGTPEPGGVLWYEMTDLHPSPYRKQVKPLFSVV